jgi:alkaline phosphatase D
MRLLLILSICIGSLQIHAQRNKAPELQSGPMLGYAEMREAAVWIQAKEEGIAVLEYEAKGKKQRSEPVELVRRNAYAATLIADQLEEGTTYTYKIFINNREVQAKHRQSFTTQKHWMYRTDPPPFRMAAGSCAYINEERSDRPGRAYGGEYKIFGSIIEQNPDAMLWLGDNVYLRPSDWTSRSGFLERYTHDRSLPELQPLLAHCPNFAIWDDHDFGPNDAFGGFIHRETALEIFDLFWPNPTLGFLDNKAAVTSFQFNGIDFFLLDNRYFRTEKTEKGMNQILGKEQIEWLIQQLKFSRSPFKMVAVGGQVLNTAAVYETHAVYAEERAYLLRRIEEENIKNVVFLTGDRHHSEVSVLKLNNGNTIYDFTISPLTSGPNTNVNEQNDNRVEGSLIMQRNFAILEFGGTFKNRSLVVRFYSAENEVLFEYKLNDN